MHMQTAGSISPKLSDGVTICKHLYGFGPLGRYHSVAGRGGVAHDPKDVAICHAEHGGGTSAPGLHGAIDHEGDVDVRLDPLALVGRRPDPRP